MKKTLLSILTLAMSAGAFAQTPSPFWSTIQNTSFTIQAAGIKFLDAVSPTDIWATGYDGFDPGFNYNWFTRSTDGGSTFTSGNIYADTNTYVLANMDAIDASNCWVSSYMKAAQAQGAIHTTTNGGTTWTDMTAVGMYTNGAAFTNIVTFVTPSVGITMGDPVGGEFEIWRTTDAGTTWGKIAGASIANPVSGEYGLVNVYTKFGSNDIWFGTNKNRVYHSTDAGQTWTVSATMTSTMGAAAGVSDVAFVDAMNGLATVSFGSTTTTLTLWSTTDGGATWTMIPALDPNFGKNDFCAIPGTTWYASCGAGTGNQLISYSTDFGVTWNSWGGTGIQYLALDFVNNTTGWAGGFSSQAVIGTEGMFKYSGSPLGITSHATAPVNVDLYPNPSNGIVTLKMPPAKEGAVINVYDALGNIVFTESFKTVGFENHTLNLQHLAKGIYNISVVKGNEIGTQKVIIQ